MKICILLIAFTLLSKFTRGDDTPFTNEDHNSISSKQSFKQAYLKLIFYAEDGIDGGFITTTYYMRGKFANIVQQFTVEGRIIKVLFSIF